MKEGAGAHKKGDAGIWWVIGAGRFRKMWKEGDIYAQEVKVGSGDEGIAPTVCQYQVPLSPSLC
jgi:hypothetical protein